jgi:uncharacterized protein YbcI
VPALEAFTPQGRIDDSQPVIRTISREIVALQKKHFGRGPVSVRTYVLDDAILVLLHGGSATFERTLADGGGAELVAPLRAAVNDIVRPEYTAAIERAVGRKVIGFTSGSQQATGLESLVFVLEKAAP